VRFVLVSWDFLRLAVSVAVGTLVGFSFRWWVGLLVDARRRLFARMWVGVALAGVAIPVVLLVDLACRGPEIVAEEGGRLRRLDEGLGVVTYLPGVCSPSCLGENRCVEICTNSHGFRGKEFQLEKPAGTYRVLLVGDSFIMGAGAVEEETLSEQLESQIKELPGRGRAEVLNLGIEGFNFHSSVRLVEGMAERLSADAVVVGFLSGDDFRPEDPWERLESCGLRLLILAAFAGAERELYELEYRRHPDLSDVAGRGALPPEIRARFDDDLERLLAVSDRARFRLVVLAWFGAGDLFDSAGGRTDVIVPQTGWQDDPHLALPGDGHPTGRGYLLFARMLSECLRP